MPRSARWQDYRRGKPVTELYAWIATDEDGSEGIVAVPTQEGHAVQLCGSSLDLVSTFRETARKASELTGLPIRLVRFVMMESVDRVGTN